MNIEGIKQPIETENTNEHEKALDKRLINIQLRFAEKKYRESEETDAGSLIKILERYTGIIGRLASQFSETIERDKRDVSREERIKTFKESVIGNINEIVSNSEGGELWMALERYISDQFDKLGEKPERPPKNSVGLIHFNERHGVIGLENRGFKEEDDFLEVHFEKLFKTDQKFLGHEEIKRELSKIAEIIVERYPQTRAIIGTSWILDNPIAKRLGFKIAGEKQVPQNSMDTWYQFIDKNGQIDQKRLDEAMKTGELPFKSVFGYMPVEEFLAKYLPKDKRGEIILKEADEAQCERANIIRQESEIFRQDWDSFVGGNMALEDFLNKFPNLTAFLKELGLEGELKKVLGEARDKKVFWKRIETGIRIQDKKVFLRLEEMTEDTIYKRLKEISEPIDKIISGKKYIEKRIIIN